MRESTKSGSPVGFPGIRAPSRGARTLVATTLLLLALSLAAQAGSDDIPLARPACGPGPKDVQGDTQPPVWDRQGQNNTSISPGQSISLYARLKDNAALDRAYLMTNETGDWRVWTDRYGSPLQLCADAGWQWAVFEWHNLKPTTSTVGWRIFFVDRAGNTNTTPVEIFETQGRLHHSQFVNCIFGSTASTLQEAINNLVFDGEEIFVCDELGPLTETVTIGLNPNFPTIKAESPQTPILVGAIDILPVVDADGTDISGLTIQGGAFGINVAANNVKLHDLRIRDLQGSSSSDAAIKLTGSSGSNISNNTLQPNNGNARGILLVDSWDTLVGNNTGVANGSVGIQVVQSNRTTIRLNNVSGNLAGVVVQDSVENVIENNTVESNFGPPPGPPGKAGPDGGAPVTGGLILDSSSGSQVRGNVLVNNSAGLVLQQANDNVVEDNVILDSAGQGGLAGLGVVFESSTNVTLRNNSLQGNRVGIGFSLDPHNEEFYNHSIDTSNTVNGRPVRYFFNAGGLVLQDVEAGHVTVAASDSVTLRNVTVERGDGIFLTLGNNTTVRDSRVANSSIGIATDVVNGGVFQHNTLINNSVGSLVLIDSDFNEVSRNTIRNSPIGMGVGEPSVGNVFRLNSLENNGVGLFFARSDVQDNVVTQNNFNNSTQLQAWAAAGGNSFNNSFGVGNFWSDITVSGLNLSDTDGDGIYDNGSQYPYGQVNGGNVSAFVVDFGPLVEPVFPVPDTLPPVITNLSCTRPINSGGAASCSAFIFDPVVGETSGLDPASVFVSVARPDGSLLWPSVSQNGNFYSFIFSNTDLLGTYNVTWSASDFVDNQGNNSTHFNATVVNITVSLDDTVVNPGQAIIVGGRAAYVVPPLPGYRGDGAANNTTILLRVRGQSGSILANYTAVTNDTGEYTVVIRAPIDVEQLFSLNLSTTTDLGIDGSNSTTFRVRSLDVTLETDRSQYAAADTAQVFGFVTYANNGSPVVGRVVTVTFLGPDKIVRGGPFTPTTNASGGYTVAFTLPGQKGTWKVEAATDDPNGIVGSNSTTFSLNVNVTIILDRPSYNIGDNVSYTVSINPFVDPLNNVDIQVLMDSTIIKELFGQTIPVGMTFTFSNSTSAPSPEADHNLTVRIVRGGSIPGEGFRTFKVRGLTVSVDVGGPYNPGDAVLIQGFVADNQTGRPVVANVTMNITLPGPSPAFALRSTNSTSAGWYFNDTFVAPENFTYTVNVSAVDDFGIRDPDLFFTVGALPTFVSSMSVHARRNAPVEVRITNVAGVQVPAASLELFFEGVKVGEQDLGPLGPGEARVVGFGVPISESNAGGTRFAVALIRDGSGVLLGGAYGRVVVRSITLQERKEAAVEILREVKTSSPELGESIDQVIGDIEASLTPAHWLDPGHADWPEGTRIFASEEKAVRRLQELMLSSPEVAGDLQQAPGLLVSVDRRLAVDAASLAATIASRAGNIAADLEFAMSAPLLDPVKRNVTESVGREIVDLRSQVLSNPIGQPIRQVLLEGLDRVEQQRQQALEAIQRENETESNRLLNQTARLASRLTDIEEANLALRVIDAGDTLQTTDPTESLVSYAQGWQRAHLALASVPRQLKGLGLLSAETSLREGDALDGQVDTLKSLINLSLDGSRWVGRSNLQWPEGRGVFEAQQEALGILDAMRPNRTRVAVAHMQELLVYADRILTQLQIRDIKELLSLIDEAVFEIKEVLGAPPPPPPGPSVLFSDDFNDEILDGWSQSQPFFSQFLGVAFLPWQVVEGRACTGTTNGSEFAILITNQTFPSSLRYETDVFFGSAEFRGVGVAEATPANFKGFIAGGLVPEGDQHLLVVAYVDFANNTFQQFTTAIPTLPSRLGVSLTTTRMEVLADGEPVFELNTSMPPFTPLVSPRAFNIVIRPFTPSCFDNALVAPPGIHNSSHNSNHNATNPGGFGGLLKAMWGIRQQNRTNSTSPNTLTFQDGYLSPWLSRATQPHNSTFPELPPGVVATNQSGVTRAVFGDRILWVQNPQGPGGEFKVLRVDTNTSVDLGLGLLAHLWEDRVAVVGGDLSHRVHDADTGEVLQVFPPFILDGRGGVATGFQGNRLVLEFLDFSAGPTGQDPIFLLDLSTGTLQDTGATGAFPQIYGDNLVFNQITFFGPGGFGEVMVRNLSTGESRNLGPGSSNFLPVGGGAIGIRQFWGDTVAFLDSDFQTYVNTKVHSLRTNTTTVLPDTIPGGVFENKAALMLGIPTDTTVPSIGVYDTTTGTVTDTAIFGFLPFLHQSLLAFTLAEATYDIDFTGDGTTADAVVGYLSLGPRHDVDISIEPSTVQVLPNQTATYTLTITNTGEVAAETIDLAVLPGPNVSQPVPDRQIRPEWVQLSQNRVILDPGQSANVTLTITPAIDWEVPEDIRYTFTATATAAAQPSNLASADGELVLQKPPPGPQHSVGVAIAPTLVSVRANGTANYRVTVINTGDFENETYGLSFSGDEIPQQVLDRRILPEWTSFNRTDVTLNPGESADVALHITPNVSWKPQENLTYPFTVTATLHTDPKVNSSTSATLVLLKPPLPSPRQVFVEQLARKFDRIRAYIEDLDLTRPGEETLLSKLDRASQARQQAAKALQEDNESLADLHLNETRDILRSMVNRSILDRAVQDLQQGRAREFNATTEAAGLFQSSWNNAILSILPGRDFTLTLFEPANRSIEPGQTLNFTLQVQNTGTLTDTYNLTLQAPEWITIETTLLTLNPDETRNLTILVAPPRVCTITPGAYPFYATATVVEGPIFAKTTGSGVTILPFHRAETHIDPNTTRIVPGDRGNSTLSVNNTGNVFDTFALAVAGPEWISLNATPVTINNCAETRVSILIAPPRVCTLTPGLYPFEATAVSTEPGVSNTSAATAEILPFHEISTTITPTQATLKPGATTTYTFTLTNDGNVRDTYIVTLTTEEIWGLFANKSLQTEWTTLDRTQVEPLSCLTEESRLDVTVPANWAGMENATYPFALYATLASDASVTDYSNATLTVLTTKRSIAEFADIELNALRRDAASLSIQAGIQKSLLSKIDNAIAQKERGLGYIIEGREKLANNMLNSASNILGAFINEVNAQSGKAIDSGNATELVSDAKTIRGYLDIAIAT